MTDMPNTNDLRALAKWLAQDCQELVGDVIAKHTANILSELRALVEERTRLRARIAELEARDLVCPDDVKRLTDALAFLGVSSPESLEESSARSGSLVRDLLDVIEEHRELFMRASRLRGGE